MLKRFKERWWALIPAAFAIWAQSYLYFNTETVFGSAGWILFVYWVLIVYLLVIFSP